MTYCIAENTYTVHCTCTAQLLVYGVAGHTYTLSIQHSYMTKLATPTAQLKYATPTIYITCLLTIIHSKFYNSLNVQLQTIIQYSILATFNHCLADHYSLHTTSTVFYHSFRVLTDHLTVHSGLQLTVIHSIF